MAEHEQEVLQAIREDIVYIKTMLVNISQQTDLKLTNLEDKIKVANHRIDDLEKQNTWLWRSVIGVVVTSVLTQML